MQPRAAASCSSQASSLLTARSATISSGRRLAASMGRCVLASCGSVDRAWITTSTSSGTRKLPSQTSGETAAGNLPANSPAAAAARSDDGSAMRISAAPDAASSTATATANSPASRIRHRLPAGSVTRRSDSTSPRPSVLSPRRRFSSPTTRFTLPSSAAVSLAPSSSGRIVRRWGSAIVPPRKPIARMPRTASASPSGETSRLRNRQSRFWWAKAFSATYCMGLPPTGQASSAKMGCTAGLDTRELAPRHP